MGFFKEKLTESEEDVRLKKIDGTMIQFDLPIFGNQTDAIIESEAPEYHFEDGGYEFSEIVLGEEGKAKSLEIIYKGKQVLIQIDAYTIQHTENKDFTDTDSDLQHIVNISDFQILGKFTGISGEGITDIKIVELIQFCTKLLEDYHMRKFYEAEEVA